MDIKKYQYIAFRLFQFSFPLFFLIITYKSIPALLFPKLSYGVVENLETSYYAYKTKYGETRRMKTRIPIITYTYENHNYRIEGGFDSHLFVGDSVQVIHSSFFPSYGKEFSIVGLLDLDLFSKTFAFFLYASGSLFAISRFDIFKFRLPIINTKRFALIVLVLLAIPLIRWLPFLINSSVVEGLISSERVMINNEYYKVINYAFKNSNLKTRTALTSTYYKDFETCDIIVGNNSPNEAYELAFFTFYSSTVLVILIISLVVLSGLWLANANNYQD